MEIQHRDRGYEPTSVDNELHNLAENISCLVTKSKVQVVQSINTALLTTYWQIGRNIVEFEQQGSAKAKYGTTLLSSLAKLLRLKLGKGYSRPNLYNMRKFYLLYPNFQTVSGKLSWSHICELLTIDDALERKFYEQECIAGNWSVRSLHRQIDSALYLRLAASKDKEGILQLAQKGAVIQQAEDIVKDTYTLEFLGLPDKIRYSEKDLEQRLIDNLQVFLLELGRGFAFIGRQYRLTINNRHYHIDLVFYHRILKCFVLIDLKKNAVTHKDIGQMNMYMGYFAKEENAPDDNPPIGIVLGHTKDELMVEYATYGMDSKLFVSKYELYLPNKDELRRFVNSVLSENNP